MTYPNAFALAFGVASFGFDAGGVPVLDDAPESSPPLVRPLPGPSGFRPLLLRELNIEVGPNDTGPA